LAYAADHHTQKRLPMMTIITGVASACPSTVAQRARIDM